MIKKTVSQNNKIKKRKAEAGFVAAEFLFSFVLVISCGLVVFALTFSLMTIEVAQYITWSAARAYSAGNLSKEESEKAGREKFKNLTAAFPLLTDQGSEWFSLTLQGVGANVSSLKPEAGNTLGDNETRHPWSGAASKLELILFKSLKIPFLGKIVSDETLFDMNLSAYILRNPSITECLDFNKNKIEVIKTQFQNLNSEININSYVPNEDNGC
jgi:hypothetical protein